MLISYQTLFSVEMLHEYFNTETFADCMLVPADETGTMFNGNLLQKFSGNTLTVLIKQGETNKPFAAPDANTLFRFYIKHRNAYLFNYSNLSIQPGKGQIIYLSNNASNLSGTVKNLTAQILPHNAATAYSIGEFAKHTTPGNENIFECIKKGSGNALADTSAWLPRGTAKFISKEDFIKQTSSSYRFSFGTDTIKKITCSIKGFKASGSALINYEAFTVEQIFTKPVTDIQLDLSALKAGRYLVSMDAVTEAGVNIHKEEMVYYDDASFQPGVIAVLEIFNNLASSDAYAMIDAAGKLTQVKYTIQFPAKNTFWKYIASNATTRIDNISGDFVFSSAVNGSDKIFTSGTPIPFLKKPQSNIMLQFTGASPPAIKAPYANPSIIKCEKDTADGSITNFFTEVYLNY